MSFFPCWCCSVPLKWGKLCPECRNQLHIIGMLQTSREKFASEILPILAHANNVKNASRLLGIRPLFLKNLLDGLFSGGDTF